MQESRPNLTPEFNSIGFPDYGFTEFELRFSYQDAVSMHRGDIKRKRALGDWCLYSVPSERSMVPAHSLTDRDIEEVAIFMAEKDMNHMLNRKVALNQ